MDSGSIASRMSNGDESQVQSLITAEPEGVGERFESVDWLQRLCRAVARSVPAAGAAVSVIVDEGQVIAAASDVKIRDVEQLQFTIGEGPGVDAYAYRRPVLVASLAVDGTRRWPGFVAAALDEGIQAAFAFPLHIGAARLGTLGVYRRQPDPLTADAVALAIAFADEAMYALIDRGDWTGAPFVLMGAMENRHMLYQAQGMVMMQLGGVSMAHAMTRLRAYAYAAERPLDQVARDIVERKLMIDPDTP